MLRLFRLMLANIGGTGAPRRSNRRSGSPVGASTLTTSAPRSANINPANGPAKKAVASITRTPASGAWKLSIASL
jgi:hypothetical protein